MKPKILLRIAAVFMLLHTIGHSFGALNWTKAPNARIAAVINGMLNEHFQFMGHESSLGLFYNGYGISMILVLLFLSIQLWLMVTQPVKAMVVLMALFLTGLVICEYLYFFPFAAVFTALAAIATWITFFKLNNN